jgi:hypothetical protein
MACEGTNSAAAAYLDLARDMGADVDFAVCANAVPSGLVTREAFEHLCDTVVHSAQQGCDAILLDLHGAMVVDGYADAEGELLRRLRACTPAPAHRRGAGLPCQLQPRTHPPRHGHRRLLHLPTCGCVRNRGPRGRSIRALLERRSARCCCGAACPC